DLAISSDLFVANEVLIHALIGECLGQKYTSGNATSQNLGLPAQWLEFPFTKTILLTIGGTAIMKLNYVIEFVADMDRAVNFYRDVLGLSLKFQSPGWSEFSTGETSLGLHPTSEKNPAGRIKLGFNVSN